MRSTKIFARALPENRQALIYSMHLDTPQDVAMILPIPVATGSGEDSVKFVSLEKYPDLFDDMELCFPQPKALSFSRSNDALPAAGGPPLKVVAVGSFNASFVPTVKDFGRLDAQFRLPDGVWEKLGQYSKHGFAVFKLRKGNSKIHPMAFTFPTALSGKLFFPTVHIHDGEVHERAKFDHVLYCQPEPSSFIESQRWTESEDHASKHVDTRKAMDLVKGGDHIHRRSMFGTLKNEDVIISAA